MSKPENIKLCHLATGQCLIGVFEQIGGRTLQVTDPIFIIIHQEAVRDNKGKPFVQTIRQLMPPLGITKGLPVILIPLDKVAIMPYEFNDAELVAAYGKQWNDLYGVPTILSVSAGHPIPVDFMQKNPA